MTRRAPRTPEILSFYQDYLENQDAEGFVARVARLYVQGTLERLVQHHYREVRRAAVLALGFMADYSGNHVLGRALLDTDRTVRLLAEAGLRAIWVRVGSPADRRELALLARMNEARQYEAVIQRASDLLARTACLAEAWHQRAIAHFHQGDFAASIGDCHEALELNPYHFLAAASMGQSYLALDNSASALESFRRALRLNPDLEGIRVQVARLARLLEEHREK